MIIAALRQLAALLALALLPALVSGAIQLKWNKQEPLGEGEVRLATAQMWGPAVLWVDARTRARYDREHIPGAILLNEDEWERLVPAFLDAWDPAQTIVVYCDRGDCDASRAVVRRLRQELQLDNSIWVLKGGWDAWRRR